jgi:hypothetical protein
MTLFDSEIERGVPRSDVENDSSETSGVLLSRMLKERGGAELNFERRLKTLIYQIAAR